MTGVGEAGVSGFEGVGEGRAAVEESGGGPLVHEGILPRQSMRESAARTYPRALPIVPVRARGLTIEGADGRRYLDCLSGAGTLALGHNHPVVLEAIRKVLDSGAPLDALDLATPVKDAFVTELFRTLPPKLADRARVRFCGPAGTDAVAAAFQLVRTATGRSGLLAFTGAPHGAFDGAADGAFEETFEETRFAVDSRITRLPYPQDYRCSFGVEGARGAGLAADWAESVLGDSRSGLPLPAGMMLEPVQSEGGVIPAPDGWMRRMRQITAARSVPLIADEVQTGVGRTGAFWAVDHSGITPDVMILSHAIGGSLPLAVLVYRDDLDAWEPGTVADTFPGNQLAMAAGTATLSYVRENSLAERAGTLGARMLDQLRDLARQFPVIGDVRGRGLMIGIELVEAEGNREAALAVAGAGPRPGTVAGAGAGAGAREGVGTGAGAGFSLGGSDADGLGLWAGAGAGAGAGAQRRARRGQGEPGRVAGAGAAAGEGEGTDRAGRGRTPSTDIGRADDGVGGLARRPRPAAQKLAAAVQRECLRRGLIVGLGGRHGSVVRLLPPLTITDEQAAAVLDRLADAVETVARNHDRGDKADPQQPHHRQTGRPGAPVERAG